MPDNGDTSIDEGGSGYYAVSAERVMQAFAMFNMRPSHFTAGGQPGAQKIYYDAKKIIEGGTDNKWGHHTLKSIQGFCQFTQLKNDVALPWQELIEHRGFYDGKEGSGPRTGNQLLTENRLQLNSQALVMWREKQSLSQQELANKTGVPTRLIAAMENGDWDTVAESTARSITEVLNVEQQILFTPIEEMAGIALSTDTDIQRLSKSKLNLTKKNMLSMTLVLMLIMTTVYLFYPNRQQQTANTDFESQISHAENKFNDSYWYATIVAIDESIPVEPTIKELWGKGAYLHLQKDGKLGFNWSTPNGYSYEPSHSWRQKDNMMTIDFGDISYSFELNEDSEELITFNNEGGIFKMIMQKM